MKKLVTFQVLLFLIYFTTLLCYVYAFDHHHLSFTTPQSKPLKHVKYVLDDEGLHEVDVKSLHIKHGKGSYGGGDLLHARSGHRNGAMKSSSFITTLVLQYVMAGLGIIVLFF
ncbi:uncharacterized protein LOC126664823 [Mercurialis annua]|uniref:uncharacterized protein LOC126664823 n=1 Tax=Mercurialis annua TaxID=3986 RepID=UPI00215E29D9|nr:uncharacterized protein LOC126664823 [Mercurialis annua]